MSNNFFSIVMADDDVEDLELFEEAILDAKPCATIYKVRSGRGAIEFLMTRDDNELPFLIILDYNMPGMSGSQVLREISYVERLQKIPKIILSTSNSKAHALECLSDGAVDYLIKPDSIQGLKQVVAKMMTYYTRGQNSQSIGR